MDLRPVKVGMALSFVVALVSCSSGPTQPAATVAAPTATTESAQPDNQGISVTPGAGEEESMALRETYTGTGNFIGKAGGEDTDGGEGEVTLNFQNSPIAEVVKTILGDILGVNYVIDDTVSGSVSMRTTRPISQDALIPVLDNLLQMNGAAIIRSQGLYEIVPIDEGMVAGLAPTVRLSADRGYQVLIVPLRYIGAREMAKILEPVKSSRAVVQADEYRNLLTIAGTQGDLFNLRETISIFDVDQLSGMSVGIFRLQNVDAKVMHDELQGIFGDTSNGPLAGMVKFTVVERLNALMVITPQQKYLRDVETWINRLDRAENPQGMNMYVYYVQNGKAANLAELLTQLFEGKRRAAAASAQQNPPRTPAPAAEAGESEIIESLRTNEQIARVDIGDVTIIPDTETNSLLILAAPADYAAVEKAINKLDVVPLQVLVEASIVEVTLGDSLQYGLQWFFKDRHGKFNGVGGLNIDNSADGGSPNLTGALNDPVNFTYAVFDAAGTRAVLNAIAGDSRINVLSSPSLMVLDNQKATIRVGDQVPIRTSETSNTSSGVIDPDTGLLTSNITSQIQYRDTGVTLEVTPRVNSGGMVMLEITQRVDDVDETTSSNIDSPTILQREIATSVAVQSGETIVLGGLIRENKEESDSGIPWLKDIPVAGALFGGKRTSTEKTELVVMITPRAVANTQEARQVTEEYKNKFEGVDLSSFR